MTRLVLAIIVSGLMMMGCQRDMKLPDEPTHEDLDFDALMGLPKGVPSPLAPIPISKNCPYPEYRDPIVAAIEMPGQVKRGYFVPRHFEYVIIKDGYWQIRNYAGFPVKPVIPGAQHCGIPGMREQLKRQN